MSHSSSNQYHLQWKGVSDGTESPYIEIPIIDSEGSVFTTSDLQGCSVVTVQIDRSKYRVYHDPRCDTIKNYLNHNATMYYPTGTASSSQGYPIVRALSFIWDIDYAVVMADNFSRSNPYFVNHKFRLEFLNGKWNRHANGKLCCGCAETGFTGIK